MIWLAGGMIVHVLSNIVSTVSFKIKAETENYVQKHGLNWTTVIQTDWARGLKGSHDRNIFKSSKMYTFFSRLKSLQSVIAPIIGWANYFVLLLHPSVLLNDRPDSVSSILSVRRNPKQTRVFADWYGWGGGGGSARLCNFCLNGPIDVKFCM